MITRKSWLNCVASSAIIRRLISCKWCIIASGPLATSYLASHSIWTTAKVLKESEVLLIYVTLLYIGCLLCINAGLSYITSQYIALRRIISQLLEMISVAERNTGRQPIGVNEPWRTKSYKSANSQLTHRKTRPIMKSVIEWIIRWTVRWLIAW